MMDKFDELLKSFDLDFCGNGKHKISLDKAFELSACDEAVIIDLRTEEETGFVRFDFAVNIPMADIPDRLDEIPEDKMIILFCSSVVRAAIVYAYLKIKGYSNVRVLPGGVVGIADQIKPGYVLKKVYGEDKKA